MNFISATSSSLSSSSYLWSSLLLVRAGGGV